MRILVLWGLACMLIGTIGTPFANSLFAWLPQVNAQAGIWSGLDRGSDAVFGWAAQLMGYSEPLAWFSGLAHFYNGLPSEPAYQFYLFRFLLGFFEGGFFPSVILYLSLWYRPQDRAKAIASFMAAIPVATVFGLPVSGLLLGLDWFGWPGWRWIFILQGILPILAGVATMFVLPDRPEDASWLLPDERKSLLEDLRREAEAKQRHFSLKVITGHLGVVLLLTVVYFCLNVNSYGLTMFMPAIIKSQSGARDAWASVLAALPYVMALLGMLINGWHSDKTGERVWHVAVPLACAGVAIALASVVDGMSLLPVLVMILLVGPVLYAHLPAFWPIPTMFLERRRRGVRDRLYQHDWQPGRVRGPVPGRPLGDRERHICRRPDEAGLLSGHLRGGDSRSGPLSAQEASTWLTPRPRERMTREQNANVNTLRYSLPSWTG